MVSTSSTTEGANDPYAATESETSQGKVYTVTGQDWDTLTAGLGEAAEERIVVNMGPQHPSTHGVLRLILELDGETVTECRLGIGYLHTGIEKNCEYRNWTQGVTFVTRMDYLAPLFNEYAYVRGVERLLGIEDDIPERATVIRVMMMELNRISSRAVKPTVMIVVAPSSLPPVARQTRCDVIRLSSIISTRMTVARSGTSSVMPSSFSTARQ